MSEADLTATAPDPDGDDSLMAGLRSGDRSCAERLTQRYWPAIRRFCASYLGDEARAEDVTQETLALLGHNEGLPDGAVRPWLYKVARNRCLDILRRQQRSPTDNRPIRTHFDAPASTMGPPTRAARRERSELIREIVCGLPEEQRCVLTLKYFEGLTRAEIADVLGLTEIAVKGRLARASEALQVELRRVDDSFR